MAEEAINSTKDLIPKLLEYTGIKVSHLYNYQQTYEINKEKERIAKQNIKIKKQLEKFKTPMSSEQLLLLNTAIQAIYSVKPVNVGCCASIKYIESLKLPIIILSDKPVQKKTI